MKIVIQGGGSFPIVSSSVFFQSWGFLGILMPEQETNLAHFEVVVPSRKGTPRKLTYSKYCHISHFLHAPFLIFPSHAFSSLSQSPFPPSLHLSSLPFANLESPHLSSPILLFNSPFYLEFHSKDRKDQLKLYPLPL